LALTVPAAAMHSPGDGDAALKVLLTGGELTADRPVAVTTFPGFDVVQMRVAAPGRGHLSASYVADPSVPVTGDAFLQLKVGPPGASPSEVRGRIHGPAPAAITGSVCLPNRHAWIVGLEGGKAPLSLFSRSYDLPKPTGSAYPTSTAPPGSSATRPRHGRLRTTGAQGRAPTVWTTSAVDGPHRPRKATSFHVSPSKSHGSHRVRGALPTRAAKEARP
jgi:hypothetical protein